MSFCFPALVTVVLGLDGFWTWCGAQSPFVAILVIAPMWGLSYVIVAGHIPRPCDFRRASLSKRGRYAIESIGTAVGNGLTLAFYGSGHLAAGAVKLALHPLHVFCEFVWDQGQTQLDLWLQAWREKQEKRRLYREEFRCDFRSFRDFERHFDNPGGFDAGQDQAEPEPEPERKPDPPKRDAFADACRLFGLPENGAFTGTN